MSQLHPYYSENFTVFNDYISKNKQTNDKNEKLMVNQALFCSAKVGCVEVSAPVIDTNEWRYLYVTE
jgi:hypothetical protein